MIILNQGSIERAHQLIPCLLQMLEYYQMTLQAQDTKNSRYLADAIQDIFHYIQYGGDLPDCLKID